MRIAYIILFLLIVGVLGSIYAYRMTQTLNYVHTSGAMQPVTPETYSAQKLYNNRQPQTTPPDSLTTDTLNK